MFSARTRPRWLAIGRPRPILLIAFIALSITLVPQIARAQQLRLSWIDNSGGQASFTIQRATGGGGAYADIAQVPVGVVSYTDTAVSFGTTYCYRVAAVNSARTSTFSNQACGTPSGGLSVTAVKAGTGSGTVASVPAGINCGTACSSGFPASSAVTLTATPATGSSFGGWSGGGCAGTSTSCTMVGNVPVSVTATFDVSVPNPVPATSSLSPSSALQNGAAFTLTVNGTGFVPASAVRWNGSPRSTTYVSATRLTASIPASDLATTGSAAVTVVTPAPGGGTSSAVAFAISAINPAPGLTSISPTSAAQGSPNLTLSVTGTGFVPASVVQWNGAPRATTYVSVSQLTASIPAGDLATAGSAPVTVFSPAPGGGTSSAIAFAVTAVNPAPAPTALAPASAPQNGAAFNLVVTGTGFAPVSTVQWNGSNRTTAFVSPTQLTATIPASDLATAGAVWITVLTPAPGGGTSSALPFTVTAPSPAPASASLGLAYNGKLRDRVGQGNTALAPDGALDGTLTVTLSAAGGRTVTGLRLDSDAPGTWDTSSASGYWALGVATTVDGGLLNTPGTMAVNFPMGDGGSVVLFASDDRAAEFLPGRKLTLTATFSDGSTATATTTVAKPAPASLTLAYNGKLRDRVGQGNAALGADGALDGTLTITLNAIGGRIVTGLRLDSDAPGTWDTDRGNLYWVLGVAATLDGNLLNAPGTMGVSFPMADGGSVVLFASDDRGAEFLPGRKLTLTATFSDGSTATAEITVP